MELKLEVAFGKVFTFKNALVVIPQFLFIQTKLNNQNPIWHCIFTVQITNVRIER